MTRPKTSDGRYWLCSVGSAPPSKPVTKPIAKPPSVAVSSLFIPPTTTPASTTIVSRSAKSGVTSGFWTVRITLTVAASRPEMSTAEPITRFALHPEQARSPEVHRGRPHVQADGRALEQQHEEQEADRGDDDRDDRDLADVDRADRDRPVEVPERGRRLAERPEREQRDALEQERDGERRDEHHGRATASGAAGRRRAPSRATARSRRRSRSRSRPQRPVPLRGERQGVGARHDQLPVREVDEPQHAEHEADADGHQRVDGAEPDGVDERPAS